MKSAKSGYQSLRQVALKAVGIATLLVFITWLMPQSAAGDVGGSPPEDSGHWSPGSVNRSDAAQGHVEISDVSPTAPAIDVPPALADEIFRLGEGKGFAGQTIDASSRMITVYWKGQVPSQVTDFIVAQQSGALIRVVDGRPYSRREVRQAATRVLNSPISASARVVKVSVNTDGSGITVYVANDAPAPDVAAAIRRSSGLGSDGVAFVAHTPRPHIQVGKKHD